MLSIGSHNPEDYNREFGFRQIAFSLKPRVTAHQRLLKSKGLVRVFDYFKKVMGGLSDYLL